MVHTDINHSNYFGDDSCGVTVFVFDDARYHWFAYDLSAPMFYAVLSFHLPSMDATKQDWFYGPYLEGYTQHMDISDERVKRIPGFIRFRRIDLFAFICKELDIDDLTNDWDVKAMRRIRDGFLVQEPLV